MKTLEIYFRTKNPTVNYFGTTGMISSPVSYKLVVLTGTGLKTCYNSSKKQTLAIGTNAS